MSNTIRLDIEGMTCNHCVKHVREALESVEGVERVDVTLEPGQAVVTGSAAPESLLQAVKDSGYSAQARP